jgi:hypothetical protein
MFEFLTTLTWAALIKWVLSNLPGLLALMVGFVGLVLASWRHVAPGPFRLSPRYFRDWLVVIFGGTLCTLGLLILLGWLKVG